MQIAPHKYERRGRLWVSPSQGNSTSPGCAAQEDKGVSLAAFLLGLGTVDSLHWAEAGITIETGVSAWADQSGNGNDVTQAGSTLQPLVVEVGIGGKPILRFDGSNDLLSGSWTEAQPYHTLTVCVPSRAGDFDQTIYDGVLLNTNLLDTDVAPDLVRAFNGSVLAATSDTDAAQLITVLADGVSSTIQINDDTPVAGNVGAADGDGVTYAARGLPTPFNHGDTDIALRIVYTAITAPKLALAQAALSAHYSLGF